MLKMRTLIEHRDLCIRPVVSRCRRHGLHLGRSDPAHQPIQAFGDHIPGRGDSGVYHRRLDDCRRRGHPVGAAALGPAVHRWPSSIPCLPYSGCLDSIRRLTISGFKFMTLSVCPLDLASNSSRSLEEHSSTRAVATRGSSWPRTILITRWIFGLCSINFGVNHLDAVADNLFYVPNWMPFEQYSGLS